MLRFIRELRNPALKCERVGHKMGVEYRQGFTRPENYRLHVCDSVTEERKACRRCGINFSAWAVTERHGFTGYSWSSDRADKFKRDGAVWDAHGFRAI